mgnify:CR=1 FL=1
MSTEKVKISVAVTTYNRPKMVDDLVKSYLAQSYKNSELVIVDDCVDDRRTQSIVEKYAQTDQRIRLIKNETNLGYCKNFLKSLMECRGEYILTLGDDDILLHEDTLAKYVDLFERYPKVSFIYSNILQFNREYAMDYAYTHFKKDTLFETLEDSLQGIWLKSCYIPGIGLRNNVDFKALYPERDWLFPQVELIGRILAKTQAYGIGEFLIGGRAHDDQLGFEAVKGKRIKKTERHSSLELPEIFETLKEYYRAEGVPIELNGEFVNEFFAQSHASILPTEKINTGNMNLLRVFFRAVRKNKGILFDGKYLFYMAISLVLPKGILIRLKDWYKKRLVEKNWSKEYEYFEKRVRAIGLMSE